MKHNNTRFGTYYVIFLSAGSSCLDNYLFLCRNHVMVKRINLDKRCGTEKMVLDKRGDRRFAMM